MMKVICSILGVIIFLWGQGAEAKDFKFPEITGWKQSGEIQTFLPKTLFEYINGAADLYLMYDFQELKVAEYLNEKKASVIIEAYRHKPPPMPLESTARNVSLMQTISMLEFRDISKKIF